MPAHAATAPKLIAPILTPPETAARMALLTELQAALTGLGVRCVLARRHRLVLRYTDKPLPPSGLTDPTLHVFTLCGTQIISTDGIAYRLNSDEELAATDDPPAAAAALIRLQQPADQLITNSATPVTPPT
jgi:hypothetical protein